MELKHYALLLWTWKWLLLASMVVAGGTAYWVSQQMAPVYESSAIVRINQAPSNAGAVDYQSLMVSERLSKTYAELLKNRPLVQTVIENLGLDTTYTEFVGNLTVTAIRDTQLIKLTMRGTNPEQAADSANEIISVFIRQEEQLQSSRYAESIENLQDQIALIEKDIETSQRDIARLSNLKRRTTEQQAEYDRLQLMLTQYRTNYSSVLQSLEEIRLTETQSTDNLVVVEPAVATFEPVAPRPLVNTMLATIVGAMLATMAVFLKEYLDDTIRSSDEVEHLTETLVLASIGRFNDTKAAKGETTPIAEAYRLLRANIDFSLLDRPLHTLVVTSSSPKEGKSTTVANLAIAIVQTGRSVVIVDTDLRRPMQHTFFGLSNEQGITNALLDRESPVDSYILPTEIENLSVLPSGPIPSNPAEMLGSQRMLQLVDALKELFDVVVFDSPPLLAVVDANMLARFCDATLLIVLAAKTRASALVRAKEQLEQTGARLVGTVLNQVTKDHGGYYGYNYHYYYSSSDSDKPGGSGKSGRMGMNKDQLVPAVYSRNGHGKPHAMEAGKRGGD